MPYISSDAIREARQVDLLTYLQSTSPGELVRLSGNTYCTREHDSLKISNGMWHWFSRGIGGRNALEYLIKVQGYSFIDAVEAILGRTAVMPSVPYTQTQKTERQILMPKLNENTIAVEKYLMRRGIAREIIDYCVSNRLLMETKDYHNALFAGYDENGKLRYGALRGTFGDFKGEVTGSDKHYSFLLADRVDADSVHLFESAIDAMSYATLLKRTGRDWQKSPLLSLAGVYKTTRENVVPVALERYLANHPKTETLLLHLDNDEIGRGATEGIMGGLKDRYRVIDHPAPDAKDVNEYLMKQIELQKAKEEYER